MVISRRELLTTASLGFASAIWPALATAHSSKTSDMLLVSACRQTDGTFAIVVFTPDGEIVREYPLTSRGHDFAHDIHTGTVVAFARRPGRFALVFNARDARPPVLFAPPLSRHFYGHGTFSKDGRLLYATENDYDNARGVVGLYDATNNYVRIGEFDSYGIGPHDILLLPDGKTLVVANGGIETHPESGRAKLNIATMTPSLVFIDTETGDLITHHHLAKRNHKLSIRHLASDANGNVWFGGQWQGDVDQVPILMGAASRDTPLALLHENVPTGASLKGYVGSVAMCSQGRWLAVSAPRAGRVVYVDTQRKRKPVISSIPDGCGLAQLQHSQFAVSSGYGNLRTQTPDGSGTEDTTLPGLALDNHMHTIR